MRSDRLLFTHSPLKASLAPIYAALLLLVAMGLIGFVIAYWPATESHEVPRTSDASEPPTRAFESGLRLPPEGRAPRSRMKSM